ncbi:MAG: acetoin utilization protein [Acidobacteriota bacterium]
MRVFTDPRCATHQVPAGFPEVPERLAGILAALAADPAFEWAPATENLDDPSALALVTTLHDPAYVARFRAAVERGDGLLDGADNPLSPGTWGAALGAVAATAAALDWTVAAPGRRAFAAVRPPGHHAERALAMGFCWFGNAALAAERARRNHGLERVAIVDVDVHHGNGTQHLFERRADVFYASLHQWPFYPGTGAAGERGSGAGEGATLNLPLAAGTGDAEARAAVEGVLEPALARFAPELVVVSAGFDAWREDPLGGLRWSEEWFGELGQRLGGAATGAARGRVLVVLEGGYDLAALPRLTRTFLAGIAAG